MSNLPGKMNRNGKRRVFTFTLSIFAHFFNWHSNFTYLCVRHDICPLCNNQVRVFSISITSCIYTFLVIRTFKSSHLAIFKHSIKYC
jgi:hypothetical protein